MYILGISGGVLAGNQDASAALLQNGRIVAAAEEERLLGIKHANGFLPKNAILYCLEKAGISLRDVAAVNPLRYVALRYFNVAGSDPECRIGQSTPQATLLTKVACEVAVGKREELLIFGTDYDTPDGTGVRDYIHVEDLAAAHLAALDYLRKGGESTTLNAGYGHGFSVREVIAMVEKVAGRKLRTREVERRAGDPPSLIAAVDRIHRTLDWKPRYDDLETICASALAWERELAGGRWSARTGT